MSNSYFDHNRNLQINGDVNFISSSESTQDHHSFLHVSQRVQATNVQSRAIERGFKLLCDNTAPSARYGSGHSFTGPQCHPGTRIAVQDHIFKWLDDVDGQIAMWMNGPVGIGKSAIAQIVAHLAAARGQLSSAFFFFRSDDTRNSAKCLVPTLAYEMTQQMPHTRALVCHTIDANPLVFSSPLEHQIASTLLQSLRPSFEMVPRGPMLVVIDGLDECLDTVTQQAIIRTFVLGLLSAAIEMIPHKILIVSRPESHIASAFAASNVFPHVKYLTLDPWDTADDIGIFLRAKLDEIKETHPLRRYIRDVWPDDASFRRLRQNSVGSFAYASVAIRYLASHNNNPEHALQDLLSLRPNRVAAAFDDLDALYRHILLSLDPKILFTVQKLLCLYVYTSVSEIGDLASRLLEDISIVEMALIHVSSLIQIYNSGQCIKLHHSSFEEFLRDKERSRELYVFCPNVASAVATALSSLWLYPIHADEFCWFSHMSEAIDYTRLNIDMTVCVLATLVATKIPVTFFPVDFGSNGDVTNPVAAFFHVLQRRSAQDSNSPCRPLFNQAFDVACGWLRSQFNLFFYGAANFNDSLDFIIRHLGIGEWINTASEDYPSAVIFRRLATKDEYGRHIIDIIWRIFPEMGYSEIFSCILEKYLTLPSDTHKADIKFFYGGKKRFTLTRLYYIVLDHHDAMIPSYCQRLEQIVMAGREALDPIPIQYISAEACIFRFFYGSACYIDREYQLAIGDEKVSDIIKGGYCLGTLEWMCFTLAIRTKEYIARVHMDLDFAYISEDVESLYCPKQL